MKIMSIASLQTLFENFNNEMAQVFQKLDN